MSWWDSPEDDDELALDESDVRTRPNPKGNRPRTKNRPEHADATTGTILGVDRGRYLLIVDEGTGTERELVAIRARERRGGAIVTGDVVDVVGDTSGAPDTLARIVRVLPRTSVLRRSADDTDTVERVIVASADQLLIVVAAANPEPRVRLVDRYLVAAFDAGITPLLCITKVDLTDPGDFLAHFATLDLPVYRSSVGNIPVAALSKALVGHRTVLVGHSGVGDLDLVNALVPSAERAIGRVNQVTGRGRHTSSSTISLRVSSNRGDGWVVDTPGIRSFGLGHVNPLNILGAFTDLARIAEGCPRGCSHLPDAPDCAIVEAAETGQLGDIGKTRLDSLQRLLAMQHER